MYDNTFGSNKSADCGPDRTDQFYFSIFHIAAIQSQRVDTRKREKEKKEKRLAQTNRHIDMKF